MLLCTHEYCYIRVDSGENVRNVNANREEGMHKQREEVRTWCKLVMSGGNPSQHPLGCPSLPSSISLLGLWDNGHPRASTWPTA